jgi:hypothetical protein
MLVIPDAKLCSQVDTDCKFVFQGKTGVLQPKLLTGATDMIAIYTVLRIDSAKIKQVAYYSEGNFLYEDSKKQIESS